MMARKFLQDLSPPKVKVTFTLISMLGLVKTVLTMKKKRMVLKKKFFFFFTPGEKQFFCWTNTEQLIGRFCFVAHVKIKSYEQKS